MVYPLVYMPLLDVVITTRVVQDRANDTFSCCSLDRGFTEIGVKM